MSKWLKKEGEEVLIKGFWESFFSDLFIKKNRFKYKESLFMNFPGDLGLWLRYHFLKSNFKKIGLNVRIWPGIRIKHPNNMEIGDRVQLGYNNHYQANGGIIIKEDTILGPEVNIWTMNHIYSDLNKPINTQGYEKKQVVIGKDCWITTKCFILPGAVIPDKCVVLPNSVVGIIKIPEGSIIGGNPAKVIGNRATIGRFSKFKKD